MSRRILVCGGRDYVDLRHDGAQRVIFDGPLYEKMDEVLSQHVSPSDVIVHGAAPGADSMASRWAARHGIEQESHLADWDNLGKRAGYVRNQEMLDSGVDFVIAFPGGRGTAMMVDIAKKAGVPGLLIKNSVVPIP